MTGLLFDTYAWVEFFLGSEEKGRKAAEMLLNQACYTSIISIAEVSEWCEKNNRDARKYVNILIKKSDVLGLNEAMLETAGKINFLRKKQIKNWGLIDSIVLTTAKTHGLQIVTGDKHFKDIEGTVVI